MCPQDAPACTDAAGFIAAAVRPRVVLTDAIHPEAHAWLAGQADVTLLDPGLAPLAAEAALRQAIEDAQGLIVRRKLPQDLFDGVHDLRAVVRHGVGLDFIPVARATELGLPVANTPEVNANAVAEYVMAAMLAVSRRLADFDAAVRRGDWRVRSDAGKLTFDLRGRTLGIVGHGAIGRRTGEIAAHGLGMQVLAHTTRPARLPAHVGAAAGLEDLFARSDFVVLACPLTERTRGMIDARVLAAARPGSALINVARGPVVREADLAQALQAGRPAAAVLDVFETQPLPADSPLRGHPRVILTPHLAGMTGDAERAMGMAAVQTQMALIRGERPENVVNPEIYTPSKEEQ